MISQVRTVIVMAILLPSAICLADKPIVIAHRGASGYLPEHTLEAKTLAHAMGADFIEQDVVLSKDNVPVVLHDIYLDTVSDVAEKFAGRKRADGRFYAIDFSHDELKQLHLTERFDHRDGKPKYPNRFPIGHSAFQIATLEEELRLIQGLNRTREKNVGVYSELKQPAWHRLEGRDISKIVLPILEKYGYSSKSDACFLQCFEFDELVRIREQLRWNGRLVYLFGKKPIEKPQGSSVEPKLQDDESWKRIASIVDGIGPDIGLIVTGDTIANRRLTDLVSKAHGFGLVVHPYTFRKDELPRCVASSDDLLDILFHQAQVDGLFSDFPDLCVEFLQTPFLMR
jgi:glycerophosphoryl diester phosphodiesterase